MEEKLVEKVNETSQKGIDKNRRNFLRYLAGGLVAGGLSYLGYETFREPSLRERVERASKDNVLGVIGNAIYNDTEGAKKFLLRKKSVLEKYNKFDVDRSDKEKVENFWRGNEYNIELGKNKEADKLASFYFENILSDIW